MYRKQHRSPHLQKNFGTQEFLLSCLFNLVTSHKCIFKRKMKNKNVFYSHCMATFLSAVPNRR